MKRAMEDRYAGMRVIGAHYPPSAFATALTRGVVFAQVALACVTVMDANALGWSSARAPAFVSELRRSKTHALLMIWVIGNIIHTNAMNTGAFEVYYAGETVFSKMSSKTLPSLDAVVRGVDALRR